MYQWIEPYLSSNSNAGVFLSGERGGKQCLWAICGPLPLFVNKVLLGLGQTHPSHTVPDCFHATAASGIHTDWSIYSLALYKGSPSTPTLDCIPRSEEAGSSAMFTFDLTRYWQLLLQSAGTILHSHLQHVTNLHHTSPETALVNRTSNICRCHEFVSVALNSLIRIRPNIFSNA